MYCRIGIAHQREHVIARCFFDVLPLNMPTIWACQACNALKGDGGVRNMSDDEAYVRDRLNLHVQAARHPDVIGLARTVMASLQRAESARERRQLIESLQPVLIWNGGTKVEDGYHRRNHFGQIAASALFSM